MHVAESIAHEADRDLPRRGAPDMASKKLYTTMESVHEPRLPLGLYVENTQGM